MILDKETLKLVKTEVLASFELNELLRMTFDEFFDEVDVQNAYEEEWDARFYKPYYRAVYEKLVEDNTMKPLFGKSYKRKRNPEHSRRLTPDYVEIISKYNKGKKLEEFLEGIDAINKSLALDGWIPRGSITSGKARKIRIVILEGDREVFHPKTSEYTPFSRLRQALSWFGPFEGTEEELVLAMSQLTPQELKKYPEEYILATLLLAKEIENTVKFLDSSRKLPTVTPIGLSPRVTHTLKEMNLDLDLPSISMAQISYNLIQKRYADPKSPKYGSLMFNRFGEPVMEREYYVKWSPNIVHNLSRFSHGDRCHACGKPIPSGRFVPIEAHDKKSGNLISMWVGQDCARNIFGIKDEGMEKK